MRQKETILSNSIKETEFFFLLLPVFAPSLNLAQLLMFVNFSRTCSSKLSFTKTYSRFIGQLKKKKKNGRGHVFFRIWPDIELSLPFDPNYLHTQFQEP